LIDFERQHHINMTIERPSVGTTTITVAGVIAVALICRTIRRQRSPVIHCHLSCRCSKVQGYIAAKREDSIRIWCFCQDCRDYADFVASQDINAENVVGKYGESRLVQVCKSDLHLTHGQELMQLSRKSPILNNKQVYMHRYYTTCCHTPLYQTVDFLGFVGVLLKNLDSALVDQFDGPVTLFPEQALKQPPDMPSNMFIPHFLWKLVRYHSSRNMGPFDYDTKPTYWGQS
jgi:hypothetical protein